MALSAEKCSLKISGNSKRFLLVKQVSQKIKDNKSKKDVKSLLGDRLGSKNSFHPLKTPEKPRVKQCFVNHILFVGNEGFCLFDTMFWEVRHNFVSPICHCSREVYEQFKFKNSPFLM